MNFNEYQEKATTTAAYPKDDKNFNYSVTYPVLGLVGEAGEIAEKIKKIYRSGEGVITDEQKLEIEKELGDVLWYLATLSTELGLSFQEVAELNIEKLFSRKDRGKLHGSGDNR